MVQTYTVRIAKSDSVSNVVYDRVIHVWWQQNAAVLALEMGQRGEDRSYIYYPASHIDHVHVIEEVGGDAR